MSRPATAERAEPHTRRLLFESMGVAVVDFRCHAGVEPTGAEEPNATHSVVLVRRGVFQRTQGRETLVADPNHVLFFNAGQPYRFSHPLPGGDDCTVLSLEAARVLELVARHAPRDAQRPETPFRLGHGLSSPRAARLQWELLGLMARPGTRLGLEDAVAELADEALRSAYASQASGQAGERPSSPARRRRRELVEAARLAVSERLEQPPSLAELACSLGCSPFHLSRTFHDEAGLSLRRYAGRLRARAAAERLARGERDLTALALEFGYADHAHFTNSFRREWGLPPSGFRALVGTRPPAASAKARKASGA